MVFKNNRIILFVLALPFAFAPQRLSAEIEGSVRARVETRFAELASLLKKEGIEYEERPLLKSYGAFGTSVFVYPNERSGLLDTAVIVAVPITTDGDSDSQEHFGMRAAVELIKLNNAAEKPVPLITAFLSDDWEKEGEYSGFENLLDVTGGISRSVVLYLNITAAPDGFTVVTGGGGKSAFPLALLMKFTDLCAEYGIPFALESKYPSLYKYRFIKPPAPVFMASQREMPLLYIGAPPPVPQDAREPLAVRNTAVMLADWTAFVMKNIKDERDTNYFITALNTNPVFFSEKLIIILAYIFGALFFAAIVLARLSAGHKRKVTGILAMVACVNFVVITIVDVTLVPLIFPSIVLLSIIFVFHAPGRTLIVSAAVALVSLVPFMDIVFNVVKLRERARETEIVEVETEAGGIKMSADTKILLERRVITLVLESKREVLRDTLKFLPASGFQNMRIGDLPVYVYSSPVPYVITEDSIDFSLGRYPPSRVALEIALPKELRGGFFLEALYPGTGGITPVARISLPVLRD
ncbi:MAG: hypothetical protein LBC77_02585 [Spirochaetaceae bacterium]|jgi:hypothetical protein|nr:hypothetical protein [Spirochaetaceae bacterium]